MDAIVKTDEAALAVSLEMFPSQQLLSQAIRHKCTGLLFNALAASSIRSEAARELLRGSRLHAQGALRQAPAVRAQLDELSRALNERGVPHAALKTGARLQEGDNVAEVTPIFDLDVLIPEDRETDALAALAPIGYVAQPVASRRPSRFLAGYRLHHHLSPLVAEGRPKTLELHRSFATPWRFSLPTNWIALRPHLKSRGSERPYEFRLNAFAAALHLIVHGTGMYRLYDTVILALDLRKAPELLTQLQSALIEERIQPLGTNAVLALAASMAGIPLEQSDRTRAFLDWVRRREGLPIPLYRRALYIDIWYGNGRSMRGSCTVMTATVFSKLAQWHGPTAAARYAASNAWGSIGAALYNAMMLR